MDTDKEGTTDNSLRRIRSSVIFLPLIFLPFFRPSDFVWFVFFVVIVISGFSVRGQIRCARIAKKSCW
jgi:hypothetical protein